MFKQINNYTILLDQQLGKGGFGTVYIAHNHKGQKLACKQIMFRNCMNNQNNQALKQMVQTELHVMNRLDHDSIVRLIDYVFEKNELYIFLEYCNGGNLYEHFRRFSKQFPNYLLHQEKYENFALEIFEGLMESLSYLYSMDVIHRDIKLENILLHDGRIKLGDFGLSKVLYNIDEQIMTTLLGTPFYQSPQLLSRQQYSPKTDVWSFGILLYEISKKSLPFTGNNEKELVRYIESQFRNGAFQAATDRIRNPFLRNLIQKMIVPNEMQRLSMKELIILSNQYCAQNNNKDCYIKNARCVQKKQSHHYQYLQLQRQQQQEQQQQPKNIIKMNEQSHQLYQYIQQYQAGQEDNQQIYKYLLIGGIIFFMLTLMTR